MLNAAFAKLIDKRKEWVCLSKENKFDFDSILAGLYNDPSHFIYEILQNAEDAGAQVVSLKLCKDSLDIYHNGRDFNFDDIDGVTGIGISTKKSDLTAIGKFGVGFKSVFAITETPYIFSGDYKIKIEDFVVPVRVTDEQVQGTLIPKENLSKHLKDGIFELRVSFESRISSYEADKQIIFTHGFVKKEQKTPKSEIEKAKSIRKLWRGGR